MAVTCNARHTRTTYRDIRCPHKLFSCIHIFIVNLILFTQKLETPIPYVKFESSLIILCHPLGSCIDMIPIPSIA